MPNMTPEQYGKLAQDEILADYDKSVLQLASAVNKKYGVPPKQFLADWNKGVAASLQEQDRKAQAGAAARRKVAMAAGLILVLLVVLLAIGGMALGLF